MIKPQTNEQVTELAARALFLLSNLRSYEKDFETTRAIATLCKDKEVLRWESRIDEWLESIGADGYISLKELIKQLSIKDDQCFEGDFEITK